VVFSFIEMMNGRILIYGLFVFALWSCAAGGIVYIDVLRPSGIVIDSAVKTVSVTARVSRLSAVDLSSNIYPDKPSETEAVSYAAGQFADAFEYFLSASPRFNRVVSIVPVITSDSSLSQLSWDAAAAMLETKRSHALVSVDYFDFHDSFRIFYDPAVYSYQASLWIICRSLWRFYDVKNRTVADEFFLRDTIYSYALGETPTVAVLSLPSIYSLISEACNSAAYHYTQRIAQVWSRETRSYHTKGNYDLRMAGWYAQSGKWDKVVEIWRFNAEKQSSRGRAKAAFNTALAYEVDDRLDDALRLALVSYGIDSSWQTLQYIKLLNNRIVVKDLINKQLYRQ